MSRTILHILLVLLFLVPSSLSFAAPNANTAASDGVCRLKSPFTWPATFRQPGAASLGTPVDPKIYYGDNGPTVVTMTTNQKNAVVALFMDMGGGYGGACTGTLVADNAVLTAAHCVRDCDDYGNNCQNLTAGQLTVYVGNDYSSPSATFGVRAVHYNPNYSGNLYGNDLAYHDNAVVILSGSASAQYASITPIAMNSTSLSSSYVDTAVQAVGYGVTHNNDYNSTKYWASLAIGSVGTYELTAGDPSSAQGVCNGDSGGPLLLSIGGAVKIIGTVSWGDGSCLADDHFSRVDANLTWINGILSQYPSGTDCEETCGNAQCGTVGSCTCGSCSTGLTCQNNQCVTTSTDCGSVTYMGCCNGSTAVWCEEGTLAEADCSAQGGCGWVNADYGYYCGGSGADPSGDLPLSCDGEPTCEQTCLAVECGSYQGCDCGGCSSGQSCQYNECVTVTDDDDDTTDDDDDDDDDDDNADDDDDNDDDDDDDDGDDDDDTTDDDDDDTIGDDDDDTVGDDDDDDDDDDDNWWEDGSGSDGCNHAGAGLSMLFLLGLGAAAWFVRNEGFSRR